jgi:hypothetical protein
VSGRLGALAAAVTSEVNARSRRAFLLALGAGLLAAFALGASALPFEIISNLLITYGVFVGAFAVTLAAVLFQQFGGDFGDALAVAGWSRLEAEDRWRKVGAGRIPRSPTEAAAWLVRHPDPSTLQAQRISALLMVGDLAAARATLDSSPGDTPYERFDVASDRWFIHFVEGEVPPLDSVEAAAAEIVDEHERRLATVGVATLRACAAVVEGRDWVAPVAAVRADLGDAAAGIVAARYIVPQWTALAAIAGVLIGGALVFGRLTGVWR